jgi:DNA-binding Xre family transcriptional regulator
MRTTLAKNIRAIRGKITQTAFARKVGVNQATIHRIELGRQNVTIDTLQRLCKKLKCSAGDLLDG